MLRETNMPRIRLRILAFEPDPDSRRELRRLLAQRFPFDLVVAARPESAEAAFRIARPAIVLLSALTPAASEEQVMWQLEKFDPEGVVPVFTVPPVITFEPNQTVSRSRRGMFRRHSEPITHDPDLVMGQIGEMLAELREALGRPMPRVMRRSILSRAGRSLDAPESSSHALMIMAPTGSVIAQVARTRTDRASRMTPEDLPCPCSLATDAGVAARLLNISRTGVLFESALKFTPEVDTSLYLVGPDTSITLPSRFVRSEVATVETRGVRYRTAARFAKEIDILAYLKPHADKPVATLHTLADLMVHVTARSSRGDYAGARAAFEVGLRQVVPACEVKLRETLVQPARGRESVYFTIPSPSGGILQATFDADHAPSADEFMLLKAASAAAAVIVQVENASLVRRTA